MNTKASLSPCATAKLLTQFSQIHFFVTHPRIERYQGATQSPSALNKSCAQHKRHLIVREHCYDCCVTLTLFCCIVCTNYREYSPFMMLVCFASTKALESDKIMQVYGAKESDVGVACVLRDY